MEETPLHARQKLPVEVIQSKSDWMVVSHAKNYEQCSRLIRIDKVGPLHLQNDCVSKKVSFLHWQPAGQPCSLPACGMTYAQPDQQFTRDWRLFDDEGTVAAELDADAAAGFEIRYLDNRRRQTHRHLFSHLGTRINRP